MLPVEYVAARNLTGHWPHHRPRTAVSSVNCAGISRKLKNTCQVQNNVSTSFLSIINDNLYKYQPVMSPVSIAIDKSDFSCHWLKVSHGLLLLFSSWNWNDQNYKKTLVNAHFYRTVIVVTVLIINTSIYLFISRNITSNVILKTFLRFVLLTVTHWLISCFVNQLSLCMDWGHLSASLR